MKEYNSEQQHFWQVSQDNQTYTELCNALYEREILQLSRLPADMLPARLSSLSFYIRKAASYILQYPSVLELDSLNASWFAKQSASCPAQKQQADPIAAFYMKAAKPGLVVPIYITELTLEVIVLDSIDEVDRDNERIHCNEHGWFSFSGTPLQTDNSDKFLLKATKPIMAAACCGHQWLNHEKTAARSLSLRELLLASRLNWQNFAKPRAAPKL